MIQIGRINGTNMVRFQASQYGLMIRVGGYRWFLKPNTYRPLFLERNGAGVKRIFNAFGWRLVGMPDNYRLARQAKDRE